MDDDQITTPSLFGLLHSNRDFSNKRDWGKNVFNNAFPASLLCYMQHKDIKPVYLVLDEDGAVRKDYIDAGSVLGGNFKDIYFVFESVYPPYEAFVSRTLPRTDLVTFTKDSNDLPSRPLNDIEIKLTAVPDHVTSELSQEHQGPEIVVRPDTIVYLAMSIIERYVSDKEILRSSLTVSGISNWNSADELRPLISKMLEELEAVMLPHLSKQQPILIQPIWRTIGKSLELDENAFDLFVWSNFAFARLFIDQASVVGTGRLTRFQRSLIWLYKMLLDFSNDGEVNHSQIIRNINFGSQTDKAFAANGRITNKYLKSNELSTPRVKKHELPNIILNNGHEMLSPERRFDASVLGNLSLFE